MGKANSGIATLISLAATLALTSACAGSADAGERYGPLTTQATSSARTQAGSAYTAQDVLAMYAKDKGLRLALPVSIPEGYVFVGFMPPDVRETRRGPQVVARKAWFNLGQETAMVCAEVLRLKGEICPETNIGVEHTGKGVYRNVSMETPVLSDTESWGGVAYSTDPTKWTWLQQ